MILISCNTVKISIDNQVLAFIIYAMKIHRKTAVLLRLKAAKNIRQYRIDECLSIIELKQKLKDKRVQVSRQTLYDWESGQTIPTITMIERIGNALGKDFISNGDIK